MIKEKLVSALIGTLFFVVFQPFGISYFDICQKIIIACGLFVIAFVSCLACEYIIRYVLRMPFDVGRGPSYMMKRGIVFQICNIFILTILLSLYFHFFVSNEEVDNHLSVENCLSMFVACLGACFFIGLYWRNVYWKRHYAKQLEEAQLLNGVLMERARNVLNSFDNQAATTHDINTATNDVITLEGSTKESVSLHLCDFLFAESEGNYVCIHYAEVSEHKQSLVRTTIKDAGAILCIKSHVMQCHRAYIVNLSHVASVESRSSGIGLKLHHCDIVIPVSKSYVNEVKERIKNPR